MKKMTGRCCTALLLLLFQMPALHAKAPHEDTAVTVRGSRFYRAGQQYQILAGSIHFQRIPRAYWRDRLEKAKAMGLNTVTTYIFWNAIEPRPGDFDFSGRNDVAAFIRLAKKVGLNVILRPGPYVCAEWDAGGLPPWLFKDPRVQVRTRDPRFMKAVDTYIQHVGDQVRPLMASHGGPVIAVQIENEYGAFGNNRSYMRAIKNDLIKYGLGSDLLFTSDGADFLANDDLKGTLTMVNFGPGHAIGAFKTLAALRPGQPLMAGEYWAGWYDKWGDKHAMTDGQEQAKELIWMLKKGYSFNLYMFDGGTTFGFLNGANIVHERGQGSHYAPLTTSYDYDAALDEAGRPTKKYWIFRAAIENYLKIKQSRLPAPMDVRSVRPFRLYQSASLWDNLPRPVHSESPKTMEDLGQGHGYILYRTNLTGPFKGTLRVGKVRDYAVAYLDRKREGVLDRRSEKRSIKLDVGPGEHILDILVENSGRVNYGHQLGDGRSGVVGPVKLGSRTLYKWLIYNLPMKSPKFIHKWSNGIVSGPAFYRGTFRLRKTFDTFWDMTHFHKGFAWVDGKNLGRLWDIGPQRSLYQPAPWLKTGKNTMIIFDYRRPGTPVVSGSVDEIRSVPGARNRNKDAG